MKLGRWQLLMLSIPGLTALLVQFPSELSSPAWHRVLANPATLNAAMVFMVLAYATKTSGLDLLLTASLSLCPWLIDASTACQYGIFSAWIFCVLQLAICKQWNWAFLPMPLYSLDLIMQIYRPFFGLNLGPYHCSPLSLLQVNEVGKSDLFWAAVCCCIMWSMGYGLKKIKSKVFAINEAAKKLSSK